jgi:hypothetical protein
VWLILSTLNYEELRLFCGVDYINPAIDTLFASMRDEYGMDVL